MVRKVQIVKNGLIVVIYEHNVRFINKYVLFLWAGGSNNFFKVRSLSILIVKKNV